MINCIKNFWDNRKYILLILVHLTFLSNIGIFKYWLISNQESVYATDIPEETKRKVNTLNIPGRWFFPGGEAPEGYLIFHPDGTIEIPSWLFGNEKGSIEWKYNPEKELLTINFKSAPSLFPKNEILAEAFGAKEPEGWIAQFVEYKKQNLSINIRVRRETEAIEFFGWLFYKEIEKK